MNNICHACGSYNTQEVINDELFNYKGKTLIIKDYKKISCNDCGESITDLDSYEKNVPLLKEFHIKVDGL